MVEWPCGLHVVLACTKHVSLGHVRCTYGRDPRGCGRDFGVSILESPLGFTFGTVGFPHY